jgi:hypothetical protein
MPFPAIVFAIAMAALLQSALVFGVVYFTIGRLFGTGRRAIGSAVIAIIAAAVLTPWQFAQQDDEAPGISQAILAIAIQASGIALWAWRTHVADQRGLAEL